MTGDYEDIIDLPHHVSGVRAQMPRMNRAAQFMPFAALTGYEEAVRETARLTEGRIELSEDARALLDAKLRLLQEHSSERPEAEFLVFRPDGRKEGGSYVSVSGAVRRVDEVAAEVMLQGGRRIALGDILDVRCDLFAMLEDQGS